MPNYAEPLMVKYLHDKGAREGIPVSGTFELTQRCNFSCEMCYVHDCKQKADPRGNRKNYVYHLEASFSVIGFHS